MRLDLAGIALRAVVRVMGQPITYTRGGTTVTARGEYQASHIGMDPDTGLRVNSRQPVLLVNREDLPWDPRKGDLVEVAGGLWTVNDPQPDGHTGWLLMLQRAAGGVFVDGVFAPGVFA
jgi:hypothetical protein